jgi:hypothetical protein
VTGAIPMKSRAGRVGTLSVVSRLRAISKASCLWIVVAIAACSPSGSVSRDVISQDLQKFYITHPVCSALAMSFPAEIQSLSDDPYGKLLLALESHGVIRRTNSHEPSWLIKSVRFEVTPRGKTYLRANEDKFVGGSKLCYAYRHIISIDSYRELSSRGGDHRLDVTYTFEMRPLDNWVLDPAIGAAGLYFLMPPRSGPITSHDVFQLVGDTWRFDGF